VVVDAARHRDAVLGAGGMAVDVHRRHRRPGTFDRRLGPLATRPPEVATGDADVDLLPRVLPDVADPQTARPRHDRIERDAERVPESVRPHARRVSAAIGERVARGHGAVEPDTEDLAFETPG